MAKTDTLTVRRDEDRLDEPLVTVESEEGDEVPQGRDWFTAPSPWKDSGKKIGMG